MPKNYNFYASKFLQKAAPPAGASSPPWRAATTPAAPLHGIGWGDWHGARATEQTKDPVILARAMEDLAAD